MNLWGGTLWLPGPTYGLVKILKIPTMTDVLESFRDSRVRDIFIAERFGDNESFGFFEGERLKIWVNDKCAAFYFFYVFIYKVKVFD